MLKISGNNGTEEIGLVTPTPVHIVLCMSWSITVIYVPNTAIYVLEIPLSLAIPNPVSQQIGQ